MQSGLAGIAARFLLEFTKISTSFFNA